MLFWRKGTITTFIPGQMRPQEFPNYFETFVRDNTTASDEGLYIVHPQFRPGTTQTHTLIPTCCVQFGVIAPGNFCIHNYHNIITASNFRRAKHSWLSNI